MESETPILLSSDRFPAQSQLGHILSLRISHFLSQLTYIEGKLFMVMLKDLPTHLRPREKLLESGPDGLSNAELLAIILGKGQKGKDVLVLAQEIVLCLETTDERDRLQKLCDLQGVGPTKACQILASIELSRRFLLDPRKIKIRSPSDALPILGKLRNSGQEEFVVLTLDGSHQLIKSHTVTVGLVNQSQVHPRETFYRAIQDQAVSIMLAHNHPSGNLEPSEADLLTTRRLVEVSKMVGIPVLDHLIVAEGGYYSIRNKYPTYFI